MKQRFGSTRSYVWLMAVGNVVALGAVAVGGPWAAAVALPVTVGLAGATFLRLKRHEAEAAAVRERHERSKDEFLAVINHELRTPLTVIMGFGRILEQGAAGPLSERQHQYVSKVVGAADRLLNMVNDMLDVAKLQHDRLQLTVEPMGVAVVVDEVMESIRPVADQKGITLTASAPAEAVIVADRTRMEQVLANLVGNAVKFTPAGGRVTVRAEVKGGQLRVEVADTGPGISREDQCRLFQRFGQLDTSAARAAGGVGLGLSVARALVEAHGGRIGVESVPGEGSTFWYTVPIAPAANAPERASA